MTNDFKFFIFQIAPFDIEFSVTHKELDFSHLLVCASKSDTLLEHNVIFNVLPVCIAKSHVVEVLDLSAL